MQSGAEDSKRDTSCDFAMQEEEARAKAAGAAIAVGLAPDGGYALPSWHELLSAAQQDCISSPKVGLNPLEGVGVDAEMSSGVRHWLRSIAPSLLAYAQVLEQNGFDSEEALQCLTEEDMIEMGIKLGHRRLLTQNLGPLSERERNESKAGGKDAVAPPSYDTVVPATQE